MPCVAGKPMVGLQAWSSTSVRLLNLVGYFLFTLPSGMSASHASRLFSWLSLWHQQKLELDAALVLLRLRIGLLFLKHWTKSRSSELYAHHWVICESWTIKKAEHQRIDAFELWCWRILLRVSWTTRRPNQSILKEMNPEYSLEGLMLNLKLQDFGRLMQRVDSLEKTLMLGKTDCRRRRGRERMRWLDGITDSNGPEFEQTLGDGEGQGSLPCCSPWGLKESDRTDDWTTTWPSLNQKYGQMIRLTLRQSALLYKCRWVDSILNRWLSYSEHKRWGINADTYYGMQIYMYTCRYIYAQI